MFNTLLPHVIIIAILLVSLAIFTVDRIRHTQNVMPSLTAAQITVSHGPKPEDGAS